MPLVIESGSRTVMRVTTPPTGWTKDTTYNDYALRVTTGSIINRTTGENFSTVFKNYNNISVPAPGLSYSPVGSTTIDNTSMVSHRHTATRHPGATVSRKFGLDYQDAVGTRAPTSTSVASSNNPGGGGSHNHPIGTIDATGSIQESGVNSEINLDIKYVDTIIAVRN